MKEKIGQRIKEVREKLGFTQEELANKLGFGWNRQTVGDIEKGQRDVKAYELAKLSQVLHSDMSYFVKIEDAPKAEPYILWRARPEDYLKLEAFFIKKCRDFNLVEKLNQVKTTDFSNLPKKDFDIQSVQYSDAYDLAEGIRNELNLGDFPSSCLMKVLEEKYGVKFLFENLDGKGSAATCVSEEFGRSIIVSSSEPWWRQNYSIAHELFHLVTWNESLFKASQNNEAFFKKNEQMAEAFAAGLLIPAESLKREIKILIRDNKIQCSELVALARQFGVSLPALLWRMVNTKIIEASVVSKILSDNEIQELDRESKQKVPDYRVSQRFIRLAYISYISGDISRSKLASMLTVPLGDLTMVLEQFGFKEIEDHEISFSHT